MDVVTLGESMVLLTPEDGLSLEDTVMFRKRLAGAESNVSIGLARLGHRVGFISRVGNDGFGRFITKTLRGEGVDVSAVRVDNHHLTGVFFKEKSVLYGTTVQYYRRNSPASAISIDDINLSLFDQAKHFHLTGITPALSQTNRETVFALLERAKSKGIQISFDPNIRLKLWSQEEAVSTLRKISSYADIALPGIEEGLLLTGQDDPEKIAEWFLQQGCKLVVVKLGSEGAYYQTTRESGRVNGFNVTLVDEVGAGDAFAAGLLSGTLDGLDVQEAVQRACALGAIAVCGKGDYETLPRREELAEFLTGKTPIVKR